MSLEELLLLKEKECEQLTIKVNRIQSALNNIDRYCTHYCHCDILNYNKSKYIYNMCEICKVNVYLHRVFETDKGKNNLKFIDVKNAVLMKCMFITDENSQCWSLRWC